jgi:hypothetical protein
MRVQLPSVPARTLGEVRLDDGNFDASQTLRPDLSSGWTILAFRARARSCKCHRPAAILGQKAGHPVDVGLSDLHRATNLYFFCRLASRAATAPLAISERRFFDNFLARAFQTQKSQDI